MPAVKVLLTRGGGISPAHIAGDGLPMSCIALEEPRGSLLSRQLQVAQSSGVVPLELGTARAYGQG